MIPSHVVFSDIILCSLQRLYHRTLCHTPGPIHIYMHACRHVCIYIYIHTCIRGSSGVESIFSDILPTHIYLSIYKSINLCLYRYGNANVTWQGQVSGARGKFAHQQGAAQGLVGCSGISLLNPPGLFLLRNFTYHPAATLTCGPSKMSLLSMS